MLGENGPESGIIILYSASEQGYLYIYIYIYIYILIILRCPWGREYKGITYLKYR